MSTGLNRVELGQFVDRDTMRFVREYAHPVERAADRIITSASGNFHQLVPSDTEEGRAFNRGVELRPIY